MPAWVDWLLGRSHGRPAEAGALVPQDPSGRAAGGDATHLHVRPAGDFWIHTDRTPPTVLTWHVTDTSVARVEVSADTLSAMVRVLNPGRAVLTISDGLTTHRKVIDVRPHEAIEARPIGCIIEPILNVAGAGSGHGSPTSSDETPAPAQLAEA